MKKQFYNIRYKLIDNRLLATKKRLEEKQISIIAMVFWINLKPIWVGWWWGKLVPYGLFMGNNTFHCRLAE